MKNLTLSKGSFFVVAAMMGMGIAGCTSSRPVAETKAQPVAKTKAQARVQGARIADCTIDEPQDGSIKVRETSESPRRNDYWVDWTGKCLAVKIELQVYGVDLTTQTAYYYGTNTLMFPDGVSSHVKVPIDWYLGDRKPTGTFVVQRDLVVYFDDGTKIPYKNTTHTKEDIDGY